jgi:hypothetical protein
MTAPAQTTPQGKAPVLIEPGFHISATTGTLYETSKKAVEPAAGTRQTGTTLWARWGSNNNYAQELIDAVSADPAAALLEKRRAMHWGRGLMFYKKTYDKKGNEQIEFVPDEKVPQEILDFMWLNDWPNQQQGFIADFEFWESFYVQYIKNGAGKIAQAKWQRTKDVRPEKRDPSTGKINNYFLSGMWPDPKEGEYVKIPAFDRLTGNYGIYRHQLVSIDKDYFPQPAWHGIKRWLHIAGKIPRWILANIDNSLNIKYHVKIPLDYILKMVPQEAYGTDQEWKKAIQDFESALYTKIDSYLAGEQNVHKAFYSKVAVDDQGKAMPGWEILVIENKIQDEAWLRAYGTAAMAITSGIGLSPSISGQILPNGLGSGSGSDLREQFNFYMQVMTAQPRQTTLEPWELIKRINGWPKDLHLGYRDVVLQSTDQNKSGFATQNEQSPTNDSESADDNKDPMKV